MDRRRRALAAARFIICVSETVAVTAYNTGQNRENLRLRRRISVVLRSANYTITTNSTCTFCFDLSIFSVKNEITMEAKLKFDQMENIDIDIYIHVVFNVPDHESNRTEYDEAGIVCRCSSKAGSRLCRAPIP